MVGELGNGRVDRGRFGKVAMNSVYSLAGSDTGHVKHMYGRSAIAQLVDDSSTDACGASSDRYHLVVSLVTH